MAILGTFRLKDYTIEAGVWKLHFENNNPGGGNPTDYYVTIPGSELPANINQIQLASTLKQWLGWSVNQTFAPLNTFIANNTAVVLP